MGTQSRVRHVGTHRGRLGPAYTMHAHRQTSEQTHGARAHTANACQKVTTDTPCRWQRQVLCPRTRKPAGLRTQVRTGIVTETLITPCHAACTERTRDVPSAVCEPWHVGACMTRASSVQVRDARARGRARAPAPGGSNVALVLVELASAALSIWLGAPDEEPDASAGGTVHRALAHGADACHMVAHVVTWLLQERTVVGIVVIMLILLALRMRKCVACAGSGAFMRKHNTSHASSLVFERAVALLALATTWFILCVAATAAWQIWKLSSFAACWPSVNAAGTTVASITRITVMNMAVVAHTVGSRLRAIALATDVCVLRIQSAVVDVLHAATPIGPLAAQAGFLMSAAFAAIGIDARSVLRAHVRRCSAAFAMWGWGWGLPLAAFVCGSILPWQHARLWTMAYMAGLTVAARASLWRTAAFVTISGAACSALLFFGSEVVFTAAQALAPSLMAAWHIAFMACLRAAHVFPLWTVTCFTALLISDPGLVIAHIAFALHLPYLIVTTPCKLCYCVMCCLRTQAPDKKQQGEQQAGSKPTRRHRTRRKHRHRRSRVGKQHVPTVFWQAHFSRAEQHKRKQSKMSFARTYVAACKSARTPSYQTGSQRRCAWRLTKQLRAQAAAELPSWLMQIRLASVCFAAATVAMQYAPPTFKDEHELLLASCLALALALRWWRVRVLQARRARLLARAMRRARNDMAPMLKRYQTNARIARASRSARRHKAQSAWDGACGAHIDTAHYLQRTWSGIRFICDMSCSCRLCMD